MWPKRVIFQCNIDSKYKIHKMWFDPLTITCGFCLSGPWPFYFPYSIPLFLLGSSSHWSLWNCSSRSPAQFPTKCWAEDPRRWVSESFSPGKWSLKKRDLWLGPSCSVPKIYVVEMFWALLTPALPQALCVIVSSTPVSFLVFPIRWLGFLILMAGVSFLREPYPSVHGFPSSLW